MAGFLYLWPEKYKKHFTLIAEHKALIKHVYNRYAISRCCFCNRVHNNNNKSNSCARHVIFEILRPQTARTFVPEYFKEGIENVSRHTSPNSFLLLLKFLLRALQLDRPCYVPCFPSVLLSRPHCTTQTLLSMRNFVSWSCRFSQNFQTYSKVSYIICVPNIPE